jgi:hypothetical protein
MKNRVTGALASQWKRTAALGLGLGVSPLMAGCGADKENQAADLGMAELAITQVPTDVACVRVDAAGIRSVQRDYDVKPGQNSILPMNGVPVGEVRFSATAFPSPCSLVGPGTIGTWVGDPISSQITPGQIARVLLHLRPNGNSLVGVDFLVDDKTGEVCIGEKPGCISPRDATGSSSDPLPNGAKLIASPEFGRGLAAGNIDLASPRIEQEAQEKADKQAESERGILIGLLKANNVPEDRVFRPVAPDDRLKPLANGDFELLIDSDDGKNRTPVITHGERFAVSEALRGVQGFPLRNNQLAIYNTMFSNLSPEVQKQLQLPSPREVEQFDGDALIKLNDSVALRILDLSPFLNLDLPPAGRPATCSAEEGTPAGATDQTGGSCTPKPTGIWQQHRFPLKWYATCVKNQGNRGSCVSFGITGAVEAGYAAKHSRWMNLSEERLYYKEKYPTSFGDGLSTSGSMTNMISSSFTYPFENRWDYNPSYSRTEVSVPPFFSFYTNSCNGYTGEHCSNTSHQGDYTCIDVGAQRFCGFDGNAPGDSNVRLTGNMQLLSLLTPDLGMSLGRVFLGLKVPLVLALDVTPSFDNASSNGVVTYVGGGETSRGGHAVSVMGFVNNDKLPANIPAGAGGGYFIVKNSWGSCWKDGGYIYLPYSWIKQYAYMLSTASVN